MASAPTTLLPVKVLNEALGTLLLGAFFNVALFTLELTQLWKYISMFPTDRLYIRLLVACMFAVDLLASANACALVYLYTITHWSDTAFLGQQNATIPIYSTTMAISVLFMHTFLIYRYVHLSKNYFVAAFLGAIACTAFVGDALATWSVIKFTALSDRPKLKTFALIWLSAASAADVSIALALIFELSRVKSNFARTKSLIRQLITRAVMTGCATATLAILALTTYLTNPSSNLCLTFGMSIGRACTLTVLYNLNMRKPSNLSYSSGGQHSSNIITGNNVPLESGFHFTQGHQVTGATAVNGVSVHQSSVVHVDAKAHDDSDQDYETGRFDRKDHRGDFV